METQALVHVVEQCNQDSPWVVTLMDHVLATMKKENPDINRACYRQDNAGCYDAACTILACKKVSKRTGVCVQRLDFQGGRKNRAIYLLQPWKTMNITWQATYW